MHDLAVVWDIGCTRCEEPIGQLVGGRFVHDPACTFPLRIEGGRLKCCACGGAVAPRERLDLQPEQGVTVARFRAKAR